jgi:hypothetical protein
MGLQKKKKRILRVDRALLATFRIGILVGLFFSPEGGGDISFETIVDFQALFP